MTEDEQNARWIVGYYGKENILKYAYIYPSKKEALKEFSFDIEKDSSMGTVFLAKIVKRQERKKIEKYFVKTTDVETGKTLSEGKYSVTDTEGDQC